MRTTICVLAIAFGVLTTIEIVAWNDMLLALYSTMGIQACIVALCLDYITAIYQKMNKLNDFICSDHKISSEILEKIIIVLKENNKKINQADKAYRRLYLLINNKTTNE